MFGHGFNGDWFRDRNEPLLPRALRRRITPVSGEDLKPSRPTAARSQKSTACEMCVILLAALSFLLLFVLDTNLLMSMHHLLRFTFK
jgi:hypothetical protein